ncbi:hypothetical protein FIU93_17705 [Labrenzia sp. THAF35]|uniref:hypothetical protein n=1 Tax=Labrenzia sp. THAF35 TaxID=2587854 RepID=UPI0012687DE6|nr:hypothetical protein [Labrenzia sp. THAF35]QFT68632.1 hypothetical protein FIU93_17705 [Labrenzia sp. THAF35]
MAVTFQGYWPSHPRYYFLGGPIVMPCAIKALATSSDCHGYRTNEINEANCLAEPKRSWTLDVIERDVLAQLRADLSRYRMLAHRLRLRRSAKGLSDTLVTCDDLDMSLSIVFSHVYNGYAHVVALEEIRNRQLTLL